MGPKLERLLSDIVRVVLLLVVVGSALYMMDPTNTAVFQALLIGIYLVGGTHLTRRILFPKLDLQQIALDAIKENNFAGVAVFCAVIFFLVSVMELSMKVLK